MTGVADGGPPVALRRTTSEQLSPEDVMAIRSLLWAAFADDDGGMTEEDWLHALGGTHVIAGLYGRIVGHASVVVRDIRVDARLLRTGYVEAVAVEPAIQRRAIGTELMRDVGAILAEGFELGCLGTGSPEFYERLGWRRWQGPTAVRTAEGERRTPDEDGGIMVLETPHTPVGLDLSGTISCEWRPGDVW